MGIFLILAVLLLVNNLLGFTFYYSTNQKISQIEKIESLKENGLSDKTLDVYLSNIEKRIVDRENIFVLFLNLFSQNQYSQNTISVDTLKNKGKTVDSEKFDHIAPKTKQDNEKNEIKVRSPFWHTVTSSYALLILLLILPFAPFGIDDLDKNTLLGIMVIFVLAAGLVWLFQYLLGLIPVIHGKPIINYIINFIVQSVFAIFTIRFFSKYSEN
ncbi:hypothetical protein JCM18694_33980 [Prolixibacter denitrificans]|uniref:Uncharacterized protein n=1 Tax=Prolixibacter denitrificans TaxID=1541063 RepID=A0ABQ0ZNW9_9BACT|nr:hypothetical protein JCM18694_33980 [Prolixibacter denitrificans]